MNFNSAIGASLDHTESYMTDPAFRKQWSGLSVESSNYRAQRIRVLSELLGQVTNTLEGWRVLDVGCGNGYWLRYFVECDANPQDLVGVDVSDIRFAEGRKKNPSIELMKTDGISLPFEDASFDLVTQFTCFSCIPTEPLRQQVASEIKRVLRPGGYLFWWELFSTVAPSDPNVPLVLEEYFDWPIHKKLIGRFPSPSECMRPMRGLRRLIGPVVDQAGFRPTHVAAMIGPKPGDSADNGTSSHE